MPFKLPLLLSMMFMWLQTCQAQVPQPSPAPLQPLLPGSSYAEAKAWIAAHPYLSQTPVGPLYGMEYWSLIAWRQLEDNHFVDLRLAFIDEEPGTEQGVNGTLAEAQLSLIQRRPSPGKDPDTSYDPRPWEDVAYPNPWDQSDTRGQSLITNVFGPELAQDYRNARLIFEGPEYVLAAPTEYYRHPIGSLDYRVYAWSDKVRIYLGERHGYELSDVSKADARAPYVSFKPVSRGLAQEAAGILSHNVSRFEAYRNQTKTRP